MRSTSDPVERRRRAAALRWVQVSLLGLVVLLAGFRMVEPPRYDDTLNSFTFGLMSGAALFVGVVERYRAAAANPPVEPR